MKPSVVRVGDVELHFVALGSASPVVFVHGGLADYRYWQSQLPAFASGRRAISYSRRYAFPNTNRPLVPDYSPRTDAADLAGLIELVAGGPAHVVAASIGACAALFVAADRPELVRSLVVLEPPMLRWLQEIPGGLAVWREFEKDVWETAGSAFARGDGEAGVAAFIDYFLGPGGFERLPRAVRGRIMQNAAELEAQTRSTEKFPMLERERVSVLGMPVLMLSGALTRPTHALVDAELERLLPRARRIVVPGASHDVWVDRSEICRDATLAFLAEVEAS